MKKFRFFEILALITIVSLTVLAGISCSKAQADNQKLEGVTWVLKSYGDPDNLTTVLPDKEIILSFDSGKKTVSGNGGVNGYGGDYTVNKNELTVTGVIHTLIASTNQALNTQESAFFKILESAQSFKIDGKQLTITGADGTLVFTQK